MFFSLFKQSDTVFFCSIQDTSAFTKKNIHEYAQEKSVSVWTLGGRKKVNTLFYILFNFLVRKAQLLISILDNCY